MRVGACRGVAVDTAALQAACDPGARTDTSGRRSERGYKPIPHPEGGTREPAPVLEGWGTSVLLHTRRERTSAILR